ncbi:hypothetical protein [Hwanghaeella sp.]|uniref:hypothetical protein n=1 Tax=Hwanghaeella sp. TaxID=2605943 RepID=UPI003CCB77B2
MTDFEIWSLVIGAFSAIGTVGAVAIALWATLHRRKRFVVKDIRINSTMEFPNGNTGEKPELTESSVLFLLENRQEFQFEVFSASVTVHEVAANGRSGIGGSGFASSYRGVFIPAQSQYEVKLDALGHKMPFLRQRVGKITCEIKTSAGDVVVPFPDGWKKRLLDNLVFKDDE